MEASPVSPLPTRVVLHGRGLTVDDVVAVARRHVAVELGADARAAMARSAALVDGFVAGDTPVYGVTTGFGSLAATVIPAARTAELQVALVRSHATGMGDTVEPEVVRALLLLRARSLAMAHSGVRPDLVELQLALLAGDITPVVREHGSLGASGDLAPLSHCALSLIGEGEVWGPDGVVVPTAVAFERAGLRPVTLRAKEGLALINGTDGMLGMLCHGDSTDLSDAAAALADVAAAMSVEGQPRHRPRLRSPSCRRSVPTPGQALSCTRTSTALMADSGIVASHRIGPGNLGGRATGVQDAYSLRCTPQVHGAALDTARARPPPSPSASSTAAIDNPMILPDGRVESCGNFHGAPIAIRLRLPRHRRQRAVPRSASVAPTDCSTSPDRTGCRRSSPPTPA